MIDYDALVGQLQRVSGLSRSDAERAVRATLETLAERISGGEARDLAAELPPELRPLLMSAPEPAEPFGLGEFVRRVAVREGVEESVAQDHALAVFIALGAAVAPRELRDIAAQLPSDFEPLLAAARAARDRALARDRLVGRVAELGGVDEERARRATEAVLETLAVRVSDGEVHDLMQELPPDLYAALERGLGRSRPATRMAADEFLAHVAELEGVGRDEAREHTRAVFAVLREVITGKEFSDLAAQLSADYEPLLAGAR